MKSNQPNLYNLKSILHSKRFFVKYTRILMGKILLILMACTLFFVNVFAQEINQPVAEETQWIHTSFPRFYFSDEEPLQWDFPFSDSYFGRSATIYNHELAKSSIGLAASAFRKRRETIENRDQNAQDFLTTAGFVQLSSEEYDVYPNANTIATMIGLKKLDDATLISVAISGAGYQEEWKGNAIIGDPQQGGDSKFHYGFATAADRVFHRVQNYIDENDIHGPIKIWITGFSRAAAVSGITALKLLEAGTVTDENLYAYTFATPRYAKGNIDRECPSIFNIVGSVDFIPSCPFYEFGYDRYGTTLYLPAQEFCSDYTQRKAAVSPIYFQLTGNTFWNNPFGNWMVLKGVKILSEAVATESNYRELLQQPVLNTLDMTSSFPLRIWSFVNLVFNNQEIQKMIRSAFASTEELFFIVSYHLLCQKIGLEPNPWLNDVSVRKELAREHYHETYIAWLFSQDNPEDLYIKNLCSRQFVVTGDVTVTVADPQGKTLTDLFRFSLGDSRVIIIPADNDYTLTMTARTDTNLQFFMTERISQHLYDRLITWNPSEGAFQSAGSVLTLSLPKGSGAASANFVLGGSDKWMLASDTQDMGLNNYYTTIDISHSGNTDPFFPIRVIRYIMDITKLLILLGVWLYVRMKLKREVRGRGIKMLI